MPHQANPTNGLAAALPTTEVPNSEPAYLAKVKTAAPEPIVAKGTYTVSVGGGQPGAGAPGVTGTFRIEGDLTLPE